MRKLTIVAGALLALSPLAAAVAQDAAAPMVLRANQMIRSSDGNRIGTIDSVDKAKDGTPIAVHVIFDSRFITIPASTLSTAPKGLMTSLSYADIRKMH